MRWKKALKILQKHNIQFTQHAKKQMKMRYWINMPTARKDIYNPNATTKEQKVWGTLMVYSNDRIYIVWRNNTIITVF